MQPLIATALATFLILPLMAEDERFTVFYSDEEQRPFLEKSLTELPPQDWQWVKLEQAPQTPEAIKAHTLARSYNIQVSPTLLIVAKDGRYQKLRGNLLSPAALQLALERLPEGNEPDARTVLLAQLAEERALSSDRMVSEEQLTQSITACYEALSQPCLSDDDKQLIGLRLLYPLLMRQYSRNYRERGAHNPATEAKLLEAIKAVEVARDINPSSALGREAFTQRDELRKARLQAREYE